MLDLIMDLVSIVIPVYNTGEPLRACLDSVVNQTYSNLEVIVIDDHSTDTVTLEILKEFAQKDSRIKLTLSPENHGVSYCRNLGVSMLSGAYFTFLDSDDRFFPEFVEKMYQAIIKNQTDFVVCNIINFSIDESMVDESDFIFPLSEAEYVKTTEFIHSDKFMRMPICCFGKFIKTFSYNSLKISFNESFRFAEDHEWCFELFSKLNCFTVLNFIGIQRLLRNESLTHSLSDQSLLNDLESLIIKRDLLKKYGNFEANFESFLNICFSHIHRDFKNNQDHVYLEKFRHVCSILFEDFGARIVYPPSKYDICIAFLKYKLYKFLHMKKEKEHNKAIYKCYLKILANK